MGWLKFTRTFFKKASTFDIKNRALQQLQQGGNSHDIATQFIDEMSQANPSFMTSQSVNLIIQNSWSPESLAEAINNIPAIEPQLTPSTIPPQDTTPTDELITDEETDVPEPAGILEEEEEKEEEEVVDEVPEELQEDKYKDLDISDADIVIETGLEIKNPIKQKKFTIPYTKLKRLNSSIKKIGDYRNERGEAPLAVRYLTQDGTPSGEPVPYQKEITFKDGTKAYYDFVDIILEGDPPNPLGDTVKKIKNMDGTITNKEVIYQLIAFLYLAPVQGYEPKEKRFKTFEEASNYASDQNARATQNPNDKGGALWKAGQDKKKDATTGEVFFPATYRGLWRSIIKPYPNTPPIDEKFKQGNPLDCDHCGYAKRGKTARKKIYVAIEYPAEQLRTITGERRDPTPQEAASGKQVQIGTGCVKKHKDAIGFIHNLEKLQTSAIAREQEGRQSDSFGGSSRAPKNLHQVLSHYLAAVDSKGKKGNWYYRTFGSSLKPIDFNKFKSYFFGNVRAQINRAMMAGQNVPPPKWGTPTPEHEEKSDRILQWWKEKELDPTIDLSDKLGLEQNNLISIALHDQITSEHFSSIADLVRQYEKEEGKKKREEEQRQYEEEQTRIQEQWRIENEERERQRRTENEERERQREESRTRQTGENQRLRLDTPSEVLINQPFKAKFVYQYSKPWGTGGGTNHYLKDSEGNLYKIFDRYTYDPNTRNRRPKFNFVTDEEYYLKGTKGAYDSAYRPNSTVINKPEIINPEEGEVGEPAAVATEPPVKAPQAQMPPVPVESPQVTAPVEEPQIPTTSEPITEQPLDVEKQKKLDKVKKITDYAKNVIQTGRTREIQDEWGTIVSPSREMTPEDLIPIYIQQLEKVVPDKIDREQWTETLNRTFSQRGREELLNQMESIPKLLRHNI